MKMENENKKSWKETTGEAGKERAEETGCQRTGE